MGQLADEFLDRTALQVARALPELRRWKLSATPNHLQIGLVWIADNVQFETEPGGHLSRPGHRWNWPDVLKAGVCHDAIGRDCRELCAEKTQHSGAVLAATDADDKRYLLSVVVNKLRWINHGKLLSVRFSTARRLPINTPR